MGNLSTTARSEVQPLARSLRRRSASCASCWYQDFTTACRSSIGLSDRHPYSTSVLSPVTSSTVSPHAQSIVVLRYLALLQKGGKVVVSSGNHDLTGPDSQGEQSASGWPRPRYCESPRASPYCCFRPTRQVVTKFRRWARPIATSGSLATSARPSSTWRRTLGSVASTVALCITSRSSAISPLGAPGRVTVLTRQRPCEPARHQRQGSTTRRTSRLPRR